MSTNLNPATNLYNSQNPVPTETNSGVHSEKDLTLDEVKTGIEELKTQLASKKKDTWDKAQIVLMPLVIAVTGAVATSLLNSQQEKNAQVIAQAQIQAAQIQELAKLVAAIPPSKDFLEVNPKNRLMVASLASYGHQAVPVLISLFQGTPIPLRFEIVHALAQIGEPAKPALLEALKAPDPDIRLGAIKVMEEMRTNYVSPIVEVLKKDEDENVRQQAAWTLGALGAGAETQDLMQALNDRSPLVRPAAATSLAQLRYTAATDRLGQLARSDPSDEVRGVVLVALSSFAPESTTKQILDELLQSSPNSPEVLKGLSSFLEKFPNAYPDQIKTKLCIQILMLADPLIAQSSIACLEKIRSAEAVNGLILALNHEFTPIAESAAEALGRSGTEKAVEPLVGMLNRDRDESLRITALKALGQLGNPKAKPSIEKRIHDAKSDKEREAAGFALRMIVFKNTRQ